MLLVAVLARTTSSGLPILHIRMVGVKGLTRNVLGATIAVHMEQPTEQTHWKTVLIAQGRSIRWLALATGTKVRTVYAYSSGQNRPTPGWLAKAGAALGREVTA